MHRHTRHLFRQRLRATRRHFHRKRHPRRKQVRHWHPLTALFTSLLIATGIVTQQSLMRAEVVLPPLQNFRIHTPDSTDIEVGQSVRLTAEGFYGTTPVVVKAQWNLIGNSVPGYLGNCAQSQNCTFVATDPGTALVEAEANNQRTHISIDITEPLAPPVNTFTDAIPAWAENPILDLSRRNIIHGYEDGRFGGADTLTRAQIITLIYRMLLHLEVIAEPGNCRQYYDDIRPDHYAYAPACVFWQHGWSQSLRRFRGEAPASRAETAQFLYGIVGVPLLEEWNMTLGDMLSEGQVFGDIDTEHYLFFETAVLHRAGLMTGYPDGTFGAESTLNRAEAATVVHRALETMQSMVLRF